MLRVEWERVTRLVADGVEDLLHQHWRESSIDHDDVPLAVDWSRMLTLEREGFYRVASMRSDGELIGYAAYGIAPHIQFKTSLYATCSAIFVTPERRGFAGGKLVTEAERLLVTAGVVKIVYPIPVGRGKKLGALLTRMGYAHTEDFYCRVTGRDDGRQRRTDAVHAGEPAGSG